MSPPCWTTSIPAPSAVGNMTQPRSVCYTILKSFLLIYLALLAVQLQWITRKLSATDRTSQSLLGNSVQNHSPPSPLNPEWWPWTVLPNNFEPSLHNQTVDGRQFPGLFWENRLWLLGARLTTAYDEPRSQVLDEGTHFTLFGMPGDFYKRIKNKEIRCKPNEWYNAKGSLLSYPEARQHVRLSVSLGGKPSNIEESAVKDVPMEFIRTISADVHQNNVTQVWHADLGPLGISKSELLRMYRVENSTALQLHVWIADSDTTVKSLLFTVDVPLSTGVVGQAGPVAIAPETSSILPPKTVDAALCVAVYGEDAVNYLPEFILHHVNVGFGQVVVGVLDGPLGSQQAITLQEALDDFIAEGMVSIASMDLPNLECEVNVRKQHFYNTCLYHAKGFAKYVGIWDIDEYWIPPRPGNVTLPTASQSDSQPPANGTLMSPSTDLVSGGLGRGNYSSSLTIGLVMGAVERYQNHAKCEFMWCYNAFPSLEVFLHRAPNDNGTSWSHDWTERTGMIASDFHMRSPQIDWEWAKSISRTKYAYMAGLHQVGSCWLPQEGTYMTRSDVEWSHSPYSTRKNHQHTCRNLLLENFGMIHHFSSLNRIRRAERSNFERKCASEDQEPTCVVDEYVGVYAETIREQLEERMKRR